jgi:hypothetical protein
MTGGQTNSTWLFSDYNYSLTPIDGYLRKSVSNISTFNFTLLTSTADIEWYAFKLIYNNGSVLYFGNDSTHPNGGTLAVNLNFSLMTGTIIAQTYVKRAGFDLFTMNTTYIIWSSMSAIPDAMAYAQASGLGSTTLNFIAMFIALAIGFVANKFYRTGAGIIYLGVLTGFGLFGFFTWQFLAGMWLMEIGIMMYREVF